MYNAEVRLACLGGVCALDYFLSDACVESSDLTFLSDAGVESAHLTVLSVKRCWCC